MKKSLRLTWGRDMPKPLLKIENLDVKYGDIQVLWDVNLEIKEGEIVGLIGANGAGKTTLIKAISGIVKPSSGSIRFQDAEITGEDVDKIYKRRIIQCPERRELFFGMTVKENLQMGAYHRETEEDISEGFELVYNLFPRLKERELQKAESLSGGEGRMLSIGRALMGSPKLLLLDEPSLGLQPSLVTEVFKRIEEIHSRGITVFLNEQNVLEALETTDRSYVLEQGRVSLSGDSDELIEDERIKEKYLGL